MRPIAIVLACCFSVAAQPINRQLAAEIAKIKAIDNHAHPVINDGKDQEFDALPVANLEASSDPVRLRPDSPDTATPWHALLRQSTLQAMKSAKLAPKRKEG